MSRNNADNDEGFSLKHPCGLRVERALHESSLSTRADVEARDMRNGYVWYRLPSAEIVGHQIAMSLCFYRGALESISIADEDLRYGASWDDWSEEKERARADATKRWFAALGYEVGSYPWGEVWTGFDAKSASGGGGVRFARRSSEPFRECPR